MPAERLDPLLQSLLATGLTTPDGVLLQTSLRRFADAGARACAIEASSIGIEDHRLDVDRHRRVVHRLKFLVAHAHLQAHGAVGIGGDRLTAA